MDTLYALAVILSTVKMPFVSARPPEPARIERPDTKPRREKADGRAEWRLGY